MKHQPRINRRAILALGAASSLAAAIPGRAQEKYPSRPIKLVVPYAAGGGTDFLARVVAARWSEILAQPMVVDNRPGASGMLGANAVGKTFPADGYTVLVANKATMAVNPYLYAKPAYDVNDFDLVSLGGRFDYVLVVNPNVLDVRTVADITHESRARSKGLDYGVPGMGTNHDLAMEQFKRAAGANLTRISYNGSAPALADLVSGVIPMMFMEIAGVRSYIEAGKVRPVAVGGKSRNQAYPQLPTLLESGLGFAVDDWVSFVVRKGTDPRIIQTLADSYAKVAATPDVKKKLFDFGVNVEATTPEAFKALLASDAATSRKLLTELNIRID